MRAFKFVSACLAMSAAAFVLPAQAAGTWETTLLGRDINRQEVAATDDSAVYLYDTTLDVTWLRDANANGRMDWSTANTWASNLETGSGVNMVDDWRLPIMTVADPDSNLSHNGSTDRGSNVLGSSSEMASLFFDTLGNKSVFSTSGTPQPPGVGGLKNAGSFENMQSAGYWLGTVYAPNPSSAWIFVNDSGLQLYTGKSDLYSAMAVRSGDVLASAVPESETYAMMLAGLAMVGALSRRRSRAAKPVAL